MKVHFITSRTTLENDIDTLRKVITIIHEKRHYVAFDWIEVAYRRNVDLKQPTPDWAGIYKQNLEAIAQSDVIIAETSYENFAVGYQIATAIQQRKPVLLLRKSTADKNAFVTGVEDGWVRHSEYKDMADLVPIVNRFLDDNDIKVKDLRFNFFIDRRIHNYLRWAALKTKRTKAEVIRELLKRDIEKGKY